jgi:hypothetical protein
VGYGKERERQRENLDGLHVFVGASQESDSKARIKIEQDKSADKSGWFQQAKPDAATHENHDRQGREKAEFLKRVCIGRLLVLLIGRHGEFSKDGR